MASGNTTDWALFKSKLKAAGAKSTVPRCFVFDMLLRSGHEPISMNHLLSAESASYGDRTSIYRAVKLFEKIGIVQRRYTGWKYKLELSDEFHGHHHHLTCTICGRTEVTADDAELVNSLQKLTENYGFEITEHRLEIRGICKACRQKNNSGNL